MGGPPSILVQGPRLYHPLALLLSICGFQGHDAYLHETDEKGMSMEDHVGRFICD